MPSLMDRVREWFGAPGHGQNHLDIERRLDQQKIALARLDVIVRAKARRGERRHLMTPTHPGRRATDA